MGIIFLPLLIAISILLEKFGNYLAQRFQAQGRPWKSSAMLAIVATIPLGLAGFASLPSIIELDPMDGWMTVRETFEFAAVWTAYSSIWWAVMIALRARARVMEIRK
jgi:hypothetical protein